MHRPGFIGLFGQRYERATRDTGIIEGAIEPSKLANRLRHHVSNIVLAADIAFDEGGGTLAFDALDNRRAFICLHIRYDHCGASLRECQGGRLSNAGGSAGNQRYFAFKRRR